MPEKDWSAAFERLGKLANGPDHRWAGPAHVCLCGGVFFAAIVQFFEQEIAWYAAPIKCLACGALCTAPTPVDEEVSGG